MRWLAATLMALLALSYALVALATPSAEVRPAPDDPGLGGLSRLAQTLKSAGYRVAFDPSTRPKLSPGDVVVAPVLGDKKIPEAVLRHVRAGGRAFAIGVPTELQPVAADLKVTDPTGKTATLDETEAAPPQPVQPKGTLATASNWIYEDTALSSLQQVGQGRLARLDVGATATNRFLARRDNARVVLATLSTVARRGDRLVFIAEGYGEASAPGPIEAIGPWAVGALWQTFIVLAAFGVARGIRFGLPTPERTNRRGSRELLDAVAAFYRRGKYANAVIAAAAKQHPEDAAIQAAATRQKMTEEEARLAITGLDARSGRVR